jgi:hypothetical protein
VADRLGVEVGQAYGMTEVAPAELEAILVRHPASGIRHPASGIRHPASRHRRRGRDRSQ